MAETDDIVRLRSTLDGLAPPMSSTSTPAC